MSARTLRLIVASLLAVALCPVVQARGGFGGAHGGFGGIGRGSARFGTLPPLTGGLPGARVRLVGRGFSRGSRFDHRQGYGLGYGYWGYGDYGEPYVEDPQAQVIVLRDEQASKPAPAHVVDPKLIEVPGSVEKTRQPTPPTVLVWRNGQREEVKEYAISGSFLYDYSKPRASRRISLDDFDLEATERVNQQRGVQFLIPASPSEVTVRF